MRVLISSAEKSYFSHALERKFLLTMVIEVKKEGRRVINNIKVEGRWSDDKSELMELFSLLKNEFLIFNFG